MNLNINCYIFTALHCSLRSLTEWIAVKLLGNSVYCEERYTNDAFHNIQLKTNQIFQTWSQLTHSLHFSCVLIIPAVMLYKYSLALLCSYEFSSCLSFYFLGPFKHVFCMRCTILHNVMCTVNVCWALFCHSLYLCRYIISSLLTAGCSLICVCAVIGWRWVGGCGLSCAPPPRPRQLFLRLVLLLLSSLLSLAPSVTHLSL